MSLQRILHFGNTEEQYRFCPEEIMYIEAVKGEEKSTVFLLNSENVYSLPIGLGKVAKIIDDTLQGLPDSLCKVGRSVILNLKYISDIIGANTIRLVANVNGTLIEKDLILYAKACEELAKYLNSTKARQKAYQQQHFEGGYVARSLGGNRGDISLDIVRSTSSSSTMGFMIMNYEPCERPESYYDIDEDQIMFLGV